MTSALTNGASPASPSGSAARPGWLTRVARLARKELRETLRDRRTLTTLLVMPLVLYPLLSVVFQQVILLGGASTASNVWIVGVAQFSTAGAPSAAPSPADDQAAKAQAADAFITRLRTGDAWLAAQREQPALAESPRAAGPLVPGPQPLPAGGGPQLERLKIGAVANPEELVREREIDVGVWIRPRSSAAGGPQPGADALDFELVFLPQNAFGRDLAKFIEARLRAANDAHFRRRLAALGEPTEAPSAWKLVPLRTDDDEALQLAALAPLILILMTITGAVYPAIDLTAGERERGTLEALMATPAPRLGLLLAKYVAVLTVALLTAGINCGAMAVTIWSTGMGPVLFGERGVGLAELAALFALMLLFAAFFSAVLLTVTSFARSFKEAQAYLIPLVLVSLTPGFLSLMAIKLSPLLAVTPLANIVLLARDALQGQVNPLMAAAAVISTALYALAALALAARVFGSDAILYGSQESWSDLFRRPATPRRQPTLPGAATAAAVVYPLYFVVNGSLSLLRAAPVAWQLGLACGGTVLVFAGAPYVLARLQGLQIAVAWRLGPARPAAWLAAALLGLSLWPLAYELVVTSQQLGLATLSQEDLQRLAPGVEQLVANWRHSAPPWLVLLALAAAPGVCEELFFRGYLLSAMRGRVHPAAAIALTAGAFGLFHISVGGLAALERVLSSACLGAVLGYACWRSGSVWPGVLLHVLHNSVSVALALGEERLQGTWLGHAPGAHLPAPLLLGAAACAAAGLVLLAGLPANEPSAGKPAALSAAELDPPK